MAGTIKRYDDHIEISDKETNRSYRIFEEDGKPVVETFYFTTKKKLGEEDEGSGSPEPTKPADSPAQPDKSEPTSSGRRILGIPVGN